MESQIKKKIHEGREGTDVAYWESLLTHLQVHMAKGRICKRHNEILKFRLKKMKEEQMLDLSQQGTSTRTKNMVSIYSGFFTFFGTFII